MTATGPQQATERSLSVLVVHVNFAVAEAVARRLDPVSSVTLARPAAALRQLHGDHPYDAVVLCPYMSAEDRERVLRRCSAGAAPTTSIDLLDTEDGPRVELCHCPGTGAGDVARADGSALGQVMAALRDARPVAHA